MLRSVQACLLVPVAKEHKHEGEAAGMSYLQTSQGILLTAIGAEPWTRKTDSRGLCSPKPTEQN